MPYHRLREKPLLRYFGREEDIFINWSDIEIIGEDTILVGCDFPYQTKRKGGFLKNLFK